MVRVKWEWEVCLMAKKRDKDSSIGPVVRNVRVGNTIESIMMSDRFGNPLERGMRKGLNKVKPNRKDMQRSSSLEDNSSEKRRMFSMEKDRDSSRTMNDSKMEKMHGGAIRSLQPKVPAPTSIARGSGAARPQKFRKNG